MAEIRLGDCIKVMRQMDPGEVDLTIGSPPYAGKGERYGDGTKWPVDQWIDWMGDVTKEAVRVSSNCVIWVVNGFVRKGEYHPACEGLIWRLYEQCGILCERPVIWHKNAPPNRKDWFGNDWEYCLVFRPIGSTRYFDWQSIAETPKYSSGGHFRQRATNGKRRKGGDYPKNALARPRDVFKSDPLPSLNIIDILTIYAISTKTNPNSTLRDLRQAIDSQSVREWWAGIATGILATAFLQSPVQGSSAETTGRPKAGRATAQRKEDSEEEKEADSVRAMWTDQEAGSSPQGRRRDEQRDGQFASALPLVSSEGTQDGELFGSRVRETFLRDGFLLNALPAIQEIRHAFDEMLGQRQAKNLSDLIRVTVGGGHLGSKLAFLNEAPYPEKLVEPFIKSLSRPGAKVLDPFCGSGTTLAAAQRLGRVPIGIDCRESQVALSYRRVKESTGSKYSDD